MRFVVVTGLSGAGKSQVIKFLEDLGYFCVDNLPPVMISKFAEICFKSNNDINKIALVMDVRGRRFFDEFAEGLDFLRTENYAYEVLYLEAEDNTLIKRFKESRRKHPLALNDRIITGIKREKEQLVEVRKIADLIIDTTGTTLVELGNKIKKYFGETDEGSNMGIVVNILSFGFKYGIPQDADLIFDVRFMKNPFYMENLKKLSGNDELVYEYVHTNETTKEFMKKLEDMILFLLPNYIIEGKRQLILAIGCTGGRHRSVAISNKLNKILKQNKYTCVLEHRDIESDVNQKAK